MKLILSIRPMTTLIALSFNFDGRCSKAFDADSIVRHESLLFDLFQLVWQSD